MQSQTKVRYPAFLRRSPLVGVAALGAVAGLLLALGCVVQEGVQRGDALRVAAVEEADAVWRCSASKGSAARANCLATFAASRTASPGPAR